MRLIRAPAIGRAHEQVVKMILEKGWVLQTEDDEATIEFEEIAMQVDTPLAEPMVSPHSQFQQRFVEQYARDLLQGSKASFEYDYHGRLFDWGERLTSNGQNVHVDQIAYIIEKLRTSPKSRRAIAITWNPVIDEQLDDCPCLQLVQCVLRDGTPMKLHDDNEVSSCKLHMRVVFRSNDMLTAAGANMYALVQLQKHIADQIGVPCGTYTHISLVPHIYYLRDIHDIEPFCGKGTLIQPVAEVCRACKRCPRASAV
jgi:thymidylate synthase